MIVNDSNYPVLLIPIRIETKYSVKVINNVKSYSLRVRPIPDVFSVDNFDPRLTQNEYQDATNYWNKIISLTKSNTTNFEEQRNLAWQLLVDRYGYTRSAYIAKAVIVYDPSTNPDPVNPILRPTKDIVFRQEGEYNYGAYKTFPTNFIVYGKFKDKTLDPLTFQGKPVTTTQSNTNSIIIMPFTVPTIKSNTPTSPTKTPDYSDWFTNFNSAIQIGMGMEIPLNEQQYKSGFEILVVYGVRDNITPLQSKTILEDLIKSHRYTKGFRFLKQGTPTNLVSDPSNSSSSSSSSSLDEELYSSSETQTNPLNRNIEFSKLLPDNFGSASTSIINAPDGKFFDKYLGIDTANGVYNSNNFDQTFAIMASVILWAPVLGYFINRFLTLSPNPVDQKNIQMNIRQHFIKYVRGQGIIPPFRVGNVPYGVLPVTLLSGWTDTSIFPNKDYFKMFLDSLRKRWLSEFVNDVPTVMNASKSNNDSNKSQDTLLLNILSSGAVSYSYFERLIRSLPFISDYISSQKKIPISYDEFHKKYVQSINEFLKVTFPSFIKDVSQEIPNIRSLYDLVPSEIAEPLTSPMVSFSQNEKFDDLSLRNYLKVMFDDIQSKRDKSEFITPLQGRENQAGKYIFKNTDPLLFKLLRFSSRYAGKLGESSQIDDFLTSLSFLKNLDPDVDNKKLEHLLLQTLDISTYRLDAWLSSLANQRLDYLRTKNQNGIYIGSFGWVANLSPKELLSTSTNAVYEGGYIHAPSYSHASAAAVLRNGYLSYLHNPNTTTKKDILKINLDSERTKNALDIIEGIQHVTLNELLGYRLESRIHDYGIDYIIDELRNVFPIKTDIASISDEIDPSSKEKKSPRNLVDGFLVYKNWKRLFQRMQTSLPVTRTEEQENAWISDNMKNPSNPQDIWKQFYDQIINKYDILHVIKDLKSHLNYILDLIDCLSDLCVAESVYQSINGNYVRSAAVLDGLNGDGKIPFPEIVKTPRSSVFQLQRIMLVMNAGSPRSFDLKNIGSLLWSNPRLLVEPNINNLVASYFEGLLIWIDFVDDKGNITTTLTVRLEDLLMQPIDLLYIQKDELDQRLAFYARSKNKTQKFVIRYDKSSQQNSSNPLSPVPIPIPIIGSGGGGADNIKSISDLQFLIKPLKEMFSQGQYARYTDFVSPTTKIDDALKNNNNKNIQKVTFNRFYDLIVLLAQTVQDLKKAKNEKVDGKTNPLLVVIEKKRSALIRASLFGISLAIPVSKDGFMIEVIDDLDRKIDMAIEELNGRVWPDEFKDYVTLLSQWKQKWTSLKMNEDAFLSFISSQIEANDAETFVSFFIDCVRHILKDNSFLILPPFLNNTNLISRFAVKNNLMPTVNKNIRKWIQKASYVRPKLKLFDNVVTANQILKSTNFTFYCDINKFNQTAESLANLTNADDNSSVIIALSTKTGSLENIFPPSIISNHLVGINIDTWSEKINLPTQDTAIGFNYDAPNTEAPQSMILAVTPNDQLKWNDITIRDAILETYDLARIRSVDYRSLKDLRQILSLATLNSSGEDIKI